MILFHKLKINSSFKLISKKYLMFRTHTSSLRTRSPIRKVIITTLEKKEKEEINDFSSLYLAEKNNYLSTKC